MRLCFNSDEYKYKAFIDGQHSYLGNYSNNAPQKKNVNQMTLGSYYHEDDNLYGIDNFKGELSEINIWSKVLSDEEMIEITKSCGNVKTKPNVLNWSQDVNSLSSGDFTNVNIVQLCRYGTQTIVNHILVPILLHF